MRSYRQLRKWAIADNRKRGLEAAGIDLETWRHPYTRIKASLYVETAIPIIRLAMKLRWTPNFITLIFIFSSIAALAFAFLNNETATIISLIIMFLNGSLDWADGALARSTGQETQIGAWFDPMAGRIKQVAFMSLVSVFSYQVTTNIWFLYAGIFNSLLMLVLSIVPQMGESGKSQPQTSSLSDARKRIYRDHPATKFLIAFIYFDGRARYTDTLIFLILLDLAFGIQLIVIFPFIWLLVLSSASTYLLAQITRSS